MESYVFNKDGSYNTPSGTLDTALDKFIYAYLMRGYNWKDVGNDDIIFFKPGKPGRGLYAKALYNENNYVCGFEIG